MSSRTSSRRWTGWTSRKPSLLRPMPSLRCEELENRVVPAQQFIWTGADPFLSANWSVGANWQGGIAPTGNPANGDSLVFPALPGAPTANQLNPVNNLTFAGGNGFSSLTISGNGYTITGSPISLSAGGIGNAAVRVQGGPIADTLGLNIILAAPAGNDQSFDIGTNGDSLTVTGRISGNTGSSMAKDGPGTLILAADNSGFTGDIKLNNNAGILRIQNRLALGNVLGKTIVSAGATLQVDNTGGSLITGPINEPLLINGLGVANTGALQNFAGPSTWGGTIQLTNNAAIGAAAGVLTITNQISDLVTSDLLKKGPGEVQFTVGNTYRGQTIIDDGILTIMHKDALGEPLAGGAAPTVANGTVVNKTLTGAGQLRIQAPGAPGATSLTIQDEVLVLNGDGFLSSDPSRVAPSPNGALANAAGNNVWAGSIVFGSASIGLPTTTDPRVIIGVAATTDLLVSGVVSGPLPLFKRQTGRLIFNRANTYTGTTTVEAGILNIRDSKALGSASAFSGTTVNDGAALVLEVDGTAGQQDEHGRLLGDDSVTHDPNSLKVAEPLTINGRGVGGLGGALRSLSGTNIYTGSISLGIITASGADAIGVDPDNIRPGHPSIDSSYNSIDFGATVPGSDYSLTVTGDINGGPISAGPPYTPGVILAKVGAGALLLPKVNSYTNPTQIEQGWVTIGNNHSLGADIPGLGDTMQPGTIVSAGAALHINGDGLAIPENLTLSGLGITHPYSFISQKGALLNLGGKNTWVRDIALNGQAGIGVQQVYPFSPLASPPPFPAPGPANASALTITGSMRDGASSGGLVKLGSGTLSLQGDGTYSGANEVREGTLHVQNDSALGRASSGTLTTQEAFTQTTTTVQPGGVIQLDQGLAQNNGGIAAGLQIWDEKLIMGAPGQQVLVSGPIGVTPTETGTFRLTFRGDQTNPIPVGSMVGAVPVRTPASVLQAELNNLNSIKNFGSVAVTNGGPGVYVIVFNGGLSRDATLPLITATTTSTPLGRTEVTISGGTAPLVNLAQDNAWRGPMTITDTTGTANPVGTRITVHPDSRLSIFGTIDDTSPANLTVYGKDPTVAAGRGELLLAGANSYRGITYIDQGIVTAANSLALGLGNSGAADSGTIVADGAQLQMQGNLTVTGEALTLQGSGVGAADLPNFPTQWFNIGPAPTNNGQAPNTLPTSGRITGVATDPTDPNVVYVATAGGGAWKTKNNGLTWTPLFDSPIDINGVAISSAVLYGGSIAVAPTDPRIVYFATGESNGGPIDNPVGTNNLQSNAGLDTNSSIPNDFAQDNFAGAGVYRSADSGATWELLTTGLTPGGANPIRGLAITKLVINPINADEIFVATSNLNVLRQSTTATPGVWRFDSSGVAATQGWYNMVAPEAVSPNRQKGSTAWGQAPYNQPNIGSNGTNSGGIGPPGELPITVGSPAGPDDDYRVSFPVGDINGPPKVAWSDLVIAFSPFLGQVDLYAALYVGANNEKQFVWNGQAGSPPTSQAVISAVFRTQDIHSNNPKWYEGTGAFAVVPDVRTGLFNASAAINTHGYIKLGGATDPGGGTDVVYASVLRNNLSTAQGELQEIKLISVSRITFNGTWGNTATIPATQPFGVSSPGVSTAVGQYANALLVQEGDPRTSNDNVTTTIYLGGWTTLFRSTDGGGTWQPINPAPVGGSGQPPFIHALTNDTFGNGAGANNRVLIGTDGGLWRFDPATSRYVDLNGTLGAAMMNTVDAFPSALGAALAGSRATGSMQFNNSTAWTGVNPGAANAGTIRYVPRNPSTAYAAVNGQLFQSLDGGANWSLLRTIISPPSGTGTYFPLAVDPQDPSRIVIGGPSNPAFPQGPLFEATANSNGNFINLNAVSGGVTWLAINSVGLATFQGPFTTDPGFPTLVDKLPSTYDPDTIYVVGQTSSGANLVRVTKDHGVTWQSRTPVVNSSTYTITFDGTLGGNIPGSLASFNVDQIAGTGTGVQVLAGTNRDGSPAGAEIQAITVTGQADGTMDLSFTNPDGVSDTATGLATALTGNNATAIQTALNNLDSIKNFKRSEIQTVDVLFVNNTGAFRFTCAGYPTSVILPVTATQATVQSALEGMFGAGNVDVSLSTLPGNRGTRYTISFKGALKDTDIPQVNITSVQINITSTGTAGQFNLDIYLSSGTYALTANGQTTDTPDFAVNPPSPPQTIDGALEALSSVGSGGVTVSTTSAIAGGFRYVITFTNAAATLGTARVNAAGASAGPVSTLQQGGRGWVSVTQTNASGVGVLTSLTVDPASRDTAYVTMAYPNQLAGPLVLRTTDAGQTWEDITGSSAVVGDTPIAAELAFTTAVDPRTDTLYIGTDNGVFVLNNASTAASGSFAWNTAGVALPGVQVRDLSVNQELNALTIATYGRGVYQLNLTDHAASSGALRAVSGSSRWNGPITLVADTEIGTEGTQAIQNGIAAAQLEIQGSISGAANLTKSGLGTLILSAANTYTGQTLVTEGIVRVNNPLALGASTPAATANTVVTAGAALELRSDLFNEPVTINGNGFKFNGHYTGALRNVLGSNTFTGTLTLGTTVSDPDPGDPDPLSPIGAVTIGVDTGTQLTIGDPGDPATSPSHVIDAVPATPSRLDKEGTGTLVLNTNNTYAGFTRVVQGGVQVQAPQALGAITNPVSNTRVLDGAQVQIAQKPGFGPTVALEPLLLAGFGVSVPGVGVTGALRNVFGDNTWAGPITFTSAASSGNFSPASTPPNQVAFGADDSAAPGVDTLTINTNIQQLGSMGLLKVGPGRVTLAVGNSYTGLTNVNGGFLRIQNNGSLGNTANGTDVADGATLELDGSGAPLIVAEPLTLNGIGMGGVGALNNVAGNNLYTATITLGEATILGVPVTVGSNVAIGALVGTTLTANNIVDPAIPPTVPLPNVRLPDRAVPAFGLTKVGAGTLALPNSNNYGGTTLVNDGVLRVLNANSLGANRNEVQDINVSGLSGTFTITFNGQTTGTIRFDGGDPNIGTAPTQAQAEAFVKAQLDALPSIGGVIGADGVPGSVSVTRVPIGVTGFSFQITFSGGPLANTNLPAMTTAHVSGAASPTVVTFHDGQERTIVNSGGTLELAAPLPGAAVLDPTVEKITINGQGYNDPVLGLLGALRNRTGNATTGERVLAYPIVLGSNASLEAAAGTTLRLLTPTAPTGLSNQGPITSDVTLIANQNGTAVAPEVQVFQAGNNPFSLSFLGQSTGDLGANPTRADVENALRGLASIGANNVNVVRTGSAGSYVYTITFANALGTGNQPLIVPESTFGVDVYGPGTVEYAASMDSQYLGTTTVDSGTLLLSHTGGSRAIRGPLVVGDTIGAAGDAVARETLDDQIADTSNVTVKSDGLFDLNGRTDTIANLAVLDGQVSTGVAGQLTAADVTVTGGTITVGDTGSLNAASVTMNPGATPAAINAGNNSTIAVSGTITATTSSITMGTNGTMSAGLTTLVDSTVSLGDGTTATIQGLGLTDSTITLGTSGAGATLALTGNVMVNGSAASPPTSSFINGPGALQITGANRTVTVADGGAVDDLVVNASLTASPAGLHLIKNGSGQLAFTSPTTSNTPVDLVDGTVRVGSGTTIGDVSMQGATAELDGTGAAGAVTGNGTAGSAVGTVSPGNRTTASFFDIGGGGNSVWGPATTFFVNLNNTSNTHPNPVAGADYDQLRVTGNIDLSGATLTGLVGPGVALGDSFTILTVTGGTRTGKFTPAPGHTDDVVFISGQKFAIVYTATTVVLTRDLANATVPLTSSANPSTAHQPVTISGTVTAEAGITNPTTGTVTITVNRISPTADTVVIQKTLSGGNSFTITSAELNAVAGHIGFFDENASTATFTFAAVYSDGQVVFHDSVPGTLPASPAPNPNQVVEVPQIAAPTLVVPPGGATPLMISPTNPTSVGVQDTVSVSTTVTDERAKSPTPPSWTVTVFDSGNTAVRTITGTGVIPVNGNSFPINTSWDGKNTAGTVVPDGDYRVNASFLDQYGNTRNADAVSLVTVDNTSPAITIALAASAQVIAPGTSSLVPTHTVLTSTLTDPHIVGWTLTITSGATVVHSFNGAGGTVNADWTGTQPDNVTIVPDGDYSATLVTTDAAGNKTTQIVTITVLTQPPPLTLTSNSPVVYGSPINLTATFTVPPANAGLLAGELITFTGPGLPGGGQTAPVTVTPGGVASATLTMSYPAFNFHVGTYVGYVATFAGTTSFLPSTSNPTSFSVTPATLTVTVNSGQSKVYGDPIPTLTYTTGPTQNGDNPATILTGQLATTATPTSGVLGSPYTIGQGTLAVAPGNNDYVIDFTGGTLAVTPRTLEVAGNAVSIVYGDAVPLLNAHIVSGLVNPPDTAAILTGRPGLNRNGVPAGSPLDVAHGPYSMTIGTLAAGPNYTVHFNPAANDLVVTPATLSISAVAKNATYGDIPIGSTPTLTYQITGGLISPDTPAVVTGALGLNRNGVPLASPLDVAHSPYPITQGTLTAGVNYTISFTPANLTVAPAQLIVTANSETKTYGDVNPTLSFSVGGLMYNETPAVVTGQLHTPATQASPVGQYAILGDQLGVAGGNYTLSYVGANLIVLPAPLSVAANPQTKVYGDAVPPLTVTTTGLRLGDTAATVLIGSLALNPSADASSAVGQYAITQGSLRLTANPNYALQFTPNTLTITPAPLTIRVNDAERLFLAPNPTFTATYSGFKLTDSPAIVTGLNLSTTATTSSRAGKYPITAGNPAAPNYSVTVVPGTLTIDPLPPDVAVGSGSGGLAVVNIYTPSGSLRQTLTPFGPAFSGGVRTAAVDFNGDGVTDIVAGTGPGVPTDVVVLDGTTLQEMFRVQPFEPAFTGGVYVAVGDINGDGIPELLITPDQGGGPRVRVFNGKDFSPLADFLGIEDPNFRGGARAAVGDVNGDGFGDVVVSAGFGGGPRVSGYDGQALSQGQKVHPFQDFFIFGGTDATTLRNGVFIAAGDVNGDGYADLIAGGGPGGGPRILVVDGAGLIQPGGQVANPLANFFGGDPNNRGGIRVTTKDLDNDKKADIVVGAGDGAGSQTTWYRAVDILNGAVALPVNAFDAFEHLGNGVFVG